MFNRMMSVTAVILALMVVFLAWQNLQLKEQLAAPRMPDSALAQGQPIGPIRLLDVAGAGQALTFPGDDTRTVLLFFTPDCPSCRATLPVWQQMIESLEAPPRIIGVNLAPPGASQAEVLVTSGFPFPVFSVEAEQSPGLRGISYVPATVIVDGRGTVEFVWFGELDAAQQDALRQQLLRTG